MSGAGAGRGSTHLLLEAVGDLQLHQQDAPPHVQLLVQVLKVGVDVLLHGHSLVAQLLEDLPDQVQGLRDLGQPGTRARRAGCVAMTTEGLTPDPGSPATHLLCTEASAPRRQLRCCCRPCSRVSVGWSSWSGTQSSHSARAQAGQYRWAT